MVGAGKAAASMAQAFEAAWGACEGLVVTRYGHGAPTRHIDVVEAAHPVPDQAGAEAAERILNLARSAEGEAREVGRAFGGIARSVALHGLPLPPPCVLLSGGETTVTVRGTGRGGRNAEFLLALLLATDGLPGICALAGDTDGIDGSETNAGAWFEPGTLALASTRGLDPAGFLSRNDAFGFFEASERLIHTGPTRTNVNDFRAIVIR